MKPIFSTVGIILAGVIFFYYTKPEYDSTGAVRAQIEQYQTALTRATEQKRKYEELRSRYNLIDENDRSKLEKLLPNHVDNVRLILDLDSIASRYAMGLQNVDVSTPASTAVGSGALAAAAGAGQKYDSVTIKFTTFGTYQNFLRFLESLESSLRIVDLVSLNIDPESTSGGGDQSYRYEVTLRTYWLK